MNKPAKYALLCAIGVLVIAAAVAFVLYEDKGGVTEGDIGEVSDVMESTVSENNVQNDGEVSIQGVRINVLDVNSRVFDYPDSEPSVDEILFILNSTLESESFPATITEADVKDIVYPLVSAYEDGTYLICRAEDRNDIVCCIIDSFSYEDRVNPLVRYIFTLTDKGWVVAEDKYIGEEEQWRYYISA